MYKSLLALRKTGNLLCKKIAVGNVIKRNDNTGKNPIHKDIVYCIRTFTAHADQALRQELLVSELWSGGQPKQLNPKQVESVEIAMKNEFQLIQGPPGNGNIVTSTRHIN